MVEYRGAAPVLLHRADSGRLYAFSLARRIRGVAANDAALLLSSPDFRRHTS